MKFAFVALLFALFACSVQAYISRFEYYSLGELRSDYVTVGSQSSNRGRFLFRYSASSKTLNFHVISTLSSVGAVTLNGPFSCYSKINGGAFGQNNPACVANTAPVAIKLGQGIVPAPGESVGFQIFKGAVTLSSVQESMLFERELYLVINTVVTGDNGKPTEIPSIRAQVFVYDHFSDSFYSYLIFENNRGQFDREHSKSSNSGFGYISHNPGNNNLGLVIFSNIKQPGNYVLKCNSGTKTLEQDDNPVETTLTFTDGEIPLLLEILLDDSCYIFITSAEAPNGDLYSYFYNVGSLEARGTGAAQDIQSPYISYSLATFDASYKTLDILTKHNITDTVTEAHVHAADGTVLCDLARGEQPLPVRSFCTLNETHLDALQKGELYINIHTTANAAGELRGQLVFNSKQTTALLRNSAGASSSTAVGLGVGLGVGIPILLVAAVGVFFLAKRGGGGGGGKI